MRYLAFLLVLAQPLAAKQIESIAFGSCLTQTMSQAILGKVADLNPDIFIFMGDNIYADTTNMAIKKKAYQKLTRGRYFNRLKSKSMILATWDDHDYGYNDVGASYPAKRASRRLFLSYMRNSRKNPNPGVYNSYYYGAANRRVQIILLDTRYFRSRWPRTYEEMGDKSKTMLGKGQWQWLKNEFKKPAKLRIVVSSVQLLAENELGEGWYLMPHEQQRFYNLVKSTRANGVVILSGDRHYAETSLVREKAGYNLYEFTSSGLNRTWLEGSQFENKNRFGKTFATNNFGLIKIRWKGSDALLTVEYRDDDAKVLGQYFVKLSDLK